MGKIRTIALIVLLIILVAVAGLFFLGYFKPKGAGLLIETTPFSSVFINGEQVGRTPYKETRKPGEIMVKLVPESFDEPLVPYETKVTLTSGIETVIKREFGKSENMSSGEILSFEKVGGGEASLSVVSIPDSAQISIDSSTRAFTPYKTSTLAPGKHTVLVSAPGYVEKTLDLKTFKGYKLTAFVQLAKSEKLQETDEPKEEIEESEKPEEILIEILSTPTGFLRVRSEPSTLGKEVGQVEPGEQFVLLEEDEDTGWFKIEYEKGKEGLPAKTGWISNQYAEKVNEDEELPTPTLTSSPKE